MPGEAPGFDTTVAHIARVYDYWLGGKDNFVADREVADQALRLYPQIVLSVRANRAFLNRAVRTLSVDMGIRQFLDIGTGLPSVNNTHEVAQSLAPESRIVYADNDPVVLAHARALLSSNAQGACAYVDADVRDTDKILEQATQTLDFTKPVGIMLIAIMHCIPDEDDPYRIVTRLLEAVPPGSFLVLSHSGSDLGGRGHSEMATRLNPLMATPVTQRSKAQVARFFDGTELLEPGIVVAPEWRPASEVESKAPAAVWAGIGRKA
jgi:hypothetical protein